jgi:SAM-dependent methyltransferase
VTALEEWRRLLLARAVPPAILAAAPESPWGFPAEMFRRRAALAARVGAPTPTTRRALEALPERGTILDVGVGGGATSLPLAGRAARIVGVDGQADMLEGFAAAARSAGVEPVGIEGSWPGAAERTPVADVAVCGHVVYNVPDLGPFVAALEDRAARRVVLELTERHPLAWLNDLWDRFHGVTFPDGPTADDAADALREMGIEPAWERRTDATAVGGFSRREDAIHLVRKRLCLASGRDPEIAEALGDRLSEHDGLWSAGPAEQTVITLWWNTPTAARVSW